jgi:acetyl esterase/lipase
LDTKLHPPHISEQAAAFYSQTFEQLPLIDFTNPTEITKIRNLIHPIWQTFSEQIPYSYSFEEITINGRRCYQIMPPILKHASAVILYIHGGSLCYGHPSLCKNIPVSIAHQSGIPVISIEYRLAPEHPMPAQIDDILTVISGLKTFFNQHISYGIAGHSAGANLAVTAALNATHKPKALALIGAFLDASLEGDSISFLEQFDLTTQIAIKQWHYQSFESFLGDYDRKDPSVSPLFADINGLCPTYLQGAGRDRSVSDPIRFNRKLLAQNINSTLDIWEGMWHGFQMIPWLPEADSANAATATFLSNQLRLET